MDWIEEAAGRIKRRNQILFSKTSSCLAYLNLLIPQQNHRTLVLWALSLAEESVELLEQRYPEERRPRIALEAARLWAAGRSKMREAQRRILDCHAVAKEIHSQEDIALCHAVGQACAVVHTEGHALGYPLYELTAIVFREGLERAEEPVEARCRAYVERLLWAAEEEQNSSGPWAVFLQR